ncbi:hypothetical protein B0F90DRAFT_1669045 [Multifurca ochricompacta]|uniref:Uncharacterized protein n=1 Tax=Multifurca ochricompacta TaxID=376703 RepID=A0AAD4M1N0_9AGAM|nr:hypothetical protein B0F90DRAFT_1669045 [Multifurca ochricompacta]
MVNFHDPGVIAQDAWAVVKLWHAVDGLFIWEFFTTLDYEWSVIVGRRPYRWTIWVYSLTRLSTLVAVVLNMLGFDSKTPLNCQVWAVFELIFAYLAFGAASLLIVLRINRIAVAIAAGAWLTNIGFLIHGITQIRSTWVPVQNVCGVLNIQSSKNNIIATLVTDIVLLITMLVGLLRIRRRGGSLLGLGRLLWKQGLIWLLVATAAEVTPTVFIALNLNDPLNLMFQTPSLITMSIAATRMYRSLADFGSPDISNDSTQKSGRSTSDSKPVPPAPIPLNRMEVAVHTAYEEYPTGRRDHRHHQQHHLPLSNHYGTYINTDDHINDKTRNLSIDDDLESGRSSRG